MCGGVIQLHRGNISDAFAVVNHISSMIEIRSLGLWLGTSLEDESPFVMAGLRSGHPRPSGINAAKTWMPGIADKLTQSAQMAGQSA
jgi:hypothetical protein